MLSTCICTKPLTWSCTTSFIRDYSFISLTQRLLRDKSRQVLGKGREIFRLEDTDGRVLAKRCEILQGAQMDTARGSEREMSC